VSYLYQSGYFSYLIKVGLGFGEDTCVALALFNLYLLGCQSLEETLLQKFQLYYKNSIKIQKWTFSIIVSLWASIKVITITE